MVYKDYFYVFTRSGDDLMGRVILNISNTKIYPYEKTIEILTPYVWNDCLKPIEQKQWDKIEQRYYQYAIGIIKEYFCLE